MKIEQSNIIDLADKSFSVIDGEKGWVSLGLYH